LETVVFFTLANANFAQIFFTREDPKSAYLGIHSSVPGGLGGGASDKTESEA
jgi:hypothetical protein